MTTLFDGHIHESEELLTMLLHNQTLGLSRVTHHGMGDRMQMLPSPEQLHEATIRIRTVDAPAIGLAILGNLPDASPPHAWARLAGMRHYQWFLVHGQPILVTQECSNAEQVYYSTRRTLLQTNGDSYCHPVQTTPQTWKRMRQLALQLGQLEHIQQLGIASLGFYASRDQLKFSIVRTDSIAALPAKLQNILHGALDVESNLWSPAYVERLVNDKSWVLIAFPQSSPDTSPKTPVTTSMHESASSLCQSLPDNTVCPTSEMMTVGQDYPIQCVSLSKQKSSATKGAALQVKVLGQWRIPTFETVIVRVDWLWALGLATLLLFLKAFRIGHDTQKNSMHAPLTVFIYLLAVVGYKYSKPNNAGLFSTESIATTIVDSYRTFVLVHPISVTSPMIAWSHIATYWFEVAAWRSRSIQGVLFWYLCYELIASYVNEHYHILEEDNAVRCSRVAFIAAMKQYAVDDVVRAYLLPPFFVYLYLLPNLLWEYISVYVLSIFI
ncbi:TupA-like ATPgrasp [Fragilaria crotonensis]|nr:TupA-like ATPgrasp [Fragilaria crotonensis]